MTVILTAADEFELWLKGETVEAMKLQKPLPAGMLSSVARGEKEDQVATIRALSAGVPYSPILRIAPESPA